MLIVKAKKTSLSSKSSARPNTNYLMRIPKSILNGIKCDIELDTYEINGDYTTMYSYIHNAISILPVIMELKNVKNTFSRFH